MSYQILKEFEKESLQRGECPDCGSITQWREGPSAGLSTNWTCGRCGSEFNLGPNGLFAERISDPKPQGAD